MKQQIEAQQVMHMKHQDTVQVILKLVNTVAIIKALKRPTKTSFKKNLLY